MIALLLFVNLIPLYGVLEWKWGVFELIFVFWFENVIIGLMTLLKILLNRPSDGTLWAGKLFMVPFFSFHYGMFTFVHGIFVMVLFGGERFGNIDPSNLEVTVYKIITGGEGMALMAWMLLLSNLILSYSEYIHNGLYRSATLQEVMMAPYSRIVVLHLTIIFGGFLVMALHEPLFGLIMLIVLKIAFDIYHRRREAAKERAISIEL
jgi:hypothetical protein